MTAALVVLAGGFAGGFVSGLAGFGTAVVALGIWLHVLLPVTASTLAAICSVASQAQTIRVVWHAMDRARVVPMLVAGLIGVPLGTLLLGRVDPELFRISMGLFLVGFSAVMLVARRRPHLHWGGDAANAVVGFLGGVLGGFSGLSGPLPTMWAVLRGWGKDERRAVFQAFNLTILLAALLAHAVSGMLTREVGWFALAALPGTVLGSWFGVLAYRRLSDRRFEDVVLGLLALSGLTLLWGGG